MLTVAPPLKVAASRNSAVEAKIAVTLAPGYHVNSNKPSEEYLIPLKLTWAPGALVAAEVVYPKAHLEKYEFSPKPLSVYTGNFDLVTKFKVAADATPGPGAVVGKLRYQACNNKACFPPKTVEVTLPYQVR